MYMYGGCVQEVYELNNAPEPGIYMIDDDNIRHPNVDIVTDAKNDDEHFDLCRIEEAKISLTPFIIDGEIEYKEMFDISSYVNGEEVFKSNDQPTD